MDVAGPALAFFLTKYSAYTLWSRFGLRVIGRPGTGSWLRSALLGGLRLGLGLVAGWSLALAFSAAAPAANRIGFSMVAFYPALVVVRWFEWAVVSAVIRRSASGFVAGTGRPDRLWRLGGVAVSCLSDVAVVLVIGGMGWVPC